MLPNLNPSDTQTASEKDFFLGKHHIQNVLSDTSLKFFLSIQYPKTQLQYI